MALLDGVLAVEVAPAEQRAELTERFGVARFVDEDGGRNAAAVALMQECVAAPSIQPYSGTAAFLRRHAAGCVRHEKECLETANRLVKLAEHWVSQRLWSLNRVPELVLHDDRHVENVDRLAIQLAGPLFELQCAEDRVDGLTVAELATLSMAAWLHDWGQIGCRLRGGVVSDPLDVRDLHGPITQELVCDSRLRPLHLLERDEAQHVGLLCGHHQGWTSIDVDEPRDGAVDTYTRYFGRKPPLFVQDAGLRGWDLDRAQLLTALLRVADAADVGVHRIPNVAAHEAMLIWRFDELVNEVERAPRGVGTAQQFARMRGGDRSPQLAVVEADPNGLFQRMRRWTERTSGGHIHYERHGAVKRVDFFTFEKQGSLYARAIFAATSEKAEPLAIAAVTEFVCAELEKPAGTHGVVEHILGRKRLWVERTAKAR